MFKSFNYFNYSEVVSATLFLSLLVFRQAACVIDISTKKSYDVKKMKPYNFWKYGNETIFKLLCDDEKFLCLGLYYPFFHAY